MFHPSQESIHPSETSEQRLSQAVALCRSGQKIEARHILETLIKTNPDDENIWLWYASTFSAPQTCLSILQNYSRNHPDKERTLRAIAIFERRIKKTRPPTPVQPIPAHPVPAPQKPIVSRKNKQLASIAIPILTLLAAAGILLAIFFGIQLQDFRNRYWLLQTKSEQDALALKSLQTQYQTLSTNYTGLYSQYDQLQFTYNDLDNRYKNLENSYNQLNDIKARLQSQYEDLNKQFNDLTAAFNDQRSEFYLFKQSAITPPYIMIKGREVNLAFNDGDDLIYWSVPFDSLESQIERGYRARQNLGANGFLRLRKDDGSVSSMVDFRPFVDPAPFKKVIAEIYQASPGEAEFITTVWQIVSQLTSYSTEATETPRFPLETLLAGGGDCEDTAILVASMLKAAPVDWKVSLVYLDSHHPENPVSPNHVVVYVETPTNAYTIETTSHTTMNPYTNGINGWYFEVGD